MSIHIKTLLKEAYISLNESSIGKNHISGIPTGYTDLDRAISGFRPGDLIVIAARPSMGKTTLAMNIAINISVTSKENIPTAFFSMESQKNDFTISLLAKIARVDNEHILNRKFHDSDWPRLTCAAGILHDSKLYIDDTPSISIPELRSKAHRLKREFDIGLIIIDYLQLMKAGAYLGSREQEISYISSALKSLAKELNIPVVVTAQLDRTVERRSDKRPTRNDLRSIDAIEMYADVIMFIYRDSFYCEQCRKNSCNKMHEHDAELIIAKQRNGRTGTVYLDYYGEIRMFEDIHQRDEQGNYNDNDDEGEFYREFTPT